MYRYNMPTTTYLTTEEAAFLLGYHPEHVRRLCRQGKLTWERRIGTAYLFAESELKQWAKKHGREVHL
jgi:excisionase family DNA binding protein